MPSELALMPAAVLISFKTEVKRHALKAYFPFPVSVHVTF